VHGGVKMLPKRTMATSSRRLLVFASLPALFLAACGTLVDPIDGADSAGDPATPTDAQSSANDSTNGSVSEDDSGESNGVNDSAVGDDAAPADDASDAGDLADTGAIDDSGVIVVEDTGTTPVDSGYDSGYDSGPPSPLSPAYVHYDISHVLATGQSNSIANGGRPPLSTTQPYDNLMFDTGVMTSNNCPSNDGCKGYTTPTNFIPLVEGDRFWNDVNYVVETANSGLANEVTKLSREIYLVGRPQTSETLLMSLHGRSGYPYPCIRKGGCTWINWTTYKRPFDEAMWQVQDAKALAAAKGLSYVVRGVTIIHGESDHYYPGFPMASSDGTPNKLQNYADGLIELQADYEASIKAITGQTEPIPLFVSQMSGWSTDLNHNSSVIPIDQLDAHVRSNGKVILIGPGYPLPFISDGLHYSSHSERRLGEYFAKVYARTVFEKKAWEPVRPKQVSIAGNVITVSFHAPKLPLVFDTTRVTNPGNYGFEYTDASGAPPAITNVTLTGADTVQITLASTPTGGNKRIRYAYTSVPGNIPGPTTGPRGNLRDSDDTASQAGYDLQNWCVHFDQPIP